jgi:hypothetical protein
MDELKKSFDILKYLFLHQSKDLIGQQIMPSLNMSTYLAIFPRLLCIIHIEVAVKGLRTMQ